MRQGVITAVTSRAWPAYTCTRFWCNGPSANTPPVPPYKVLPLICIGEWLLTLWVLSVPGGRTYRSFRPLYFTVYELGANGWHFGPCVSSNNAWQSREPNGVKIGLSAFVNSVCPWLLVFIKHGLFKLGTDIDSRWRYYKEVYHRRFGINELMIFCVIGTRPTKGSHDGTLPHP